MTGPQYLSFKVQKGLSPEKQNSRWVLPTAILGSSLGFIDGSVVNIALPDIRLEFDTGLPALQWIVNGYMLMLASLILIGGTAGDVFGQRRVFIFGLAGFTVTSMMCGVAPSSLWLIMARLAQGIAAAFLVPSSLALIGAAYSGEARGRAIGTWAASAALTTALGPPLGGWLIDTVGWRSIFFINVPVATIALFLALKISSSHERRRHFTLDLKGAGIAALALGVLSYGLILAGQGWSLVGLLLVLSTIPLSFLFVAVEKRTSAPMVRLGIFANRNFSAANLLTLVLYAALSGSLFLLPFVLIYVHGYSAAAAGATFLPFSIIMSLGSRWSGSIAERIGSRPMLIAGPAITGLGYVVLALSAYNSGYWAGFFPGLTVIGVGMTMSVAPLTTTVLNAASDAEGGIASGINNAAARIGGLISIATLGFAFGGSDMSTLEPSSLLDAYRLLMLAAAMLALISAGVAWAAIDLKATIAPP